MTIPVDKSPAIKSRRHPLDEVCTNTIRTLAIDAIQAANSGHPGTPMAMAPETCFAWAAGSWVSRSPGTMRRLSFRRPSAAPYATADALPS
jgi:Transketolase, thiamine diphosphate binding domain